MEKQISFGKWESVCLLINIICTQILLGFPRFMAETGGTAAWILTIYAFILSLLGFSLISGLFKRFPGKDIVDISHQVIGRLGRIAVGIFFSFYILFVISMVLRQFSENMKTIVFTTSPISFVMALFAFGMIAAVFLGLESVMRIHALAIPVLAAFYLIILLAVSPNVELDNLLPIMGNGFYKVFGEGFFRVSVFTGLLLIFFLPPFIKSFKRFKSAGYVALSISGFFMTATLLVFSTVIPYPGQLESFMPMYDLSRLISFGRFFQRVEPLFLVIWSGTAYLYLSAGLYFSMHAFNKAFNLPYSKSLIIPFTILAYNIAFLPGSVMVSIEIERLYVRTLGLLVVFGIPILLLLIAWIRKKGKIKNGVS